MQEYVLGFLFDKDSRQWVVLILKNKPDWQQGRYNGVGGKIEDRETPLQAMRREFIEEANMDVDWQPRLVIGGNDWKVHIFRSFGKVTSVQTMTEETLYVAPVKQLPDNCIENLYWIIPLLLDENATKYDVIVEKGTGTNHLELRK